MTWSNLPKKPYNVLVTTPDPERLQESARLHGHNARKTPAGTVAITIPASNKVWAEVYAYSVIWNTTDRIERIDPA